MKMMYVYTKKNDKKQSLVFFLGISNWPFFKTFQDSLIFGRIYLLGAHTEKYDCWIL